MYGKWSNPPRLGRGAAGLHRFESCHPHLLMNFKNIKETEEFVDGKKVYKGVYDNDSENKKKRRIIKTECNLCGEPTFALISNYQKSKGNYCSRSCASTHASKSYHENKESYHEPKGKISYVENLKEKEECIKCGESHPACLDFHHTNPEEKVETISRMKVEADYELEDVKQEIEKCEIVCKNCHAKEHSTR